jgi:hypothetical protein
VVDQWQAALIVAPWLYQDGPVVGERGWAREEFDLGYVFWRLAPRDDPDGGTDRVVVDRVNGEPHHYAPAPVPEVLQRYRRYRAAVPAAPLTWDPVVRARHDRRRAPVPVDVACLTLPGGTVRRARGMKGDGEPNLHPLVRELLDTLPAGRASRGSDRCAEVAVISDWLHVQDARRAAAGGPPLTAPAVRSEVLRDAVLVTHAIREPAQAMREFAATMLGYDGPPPGHTVPPCASCRALMEHFGVRAGERR